MAMNKFHILKSYFQAKRRLHWTRDEITRWHEKGIRKKVFHAKRFSPFYRSLYGNETDFSKLPIISKREMMEAFKYFNTVGLSKERALQLADKGSFQSGITIGLSSGTSGYRGIFLASKKEASLWCGNILAKTLTRSIFKKEKIALFLRANSELYETASHLRYFSLEGNYAGVQEYRPDILVAPPSVLRKLPRTYPRKVISCAEVLEPLDRKFLEDKYQQPIHQLYQCTEGFLAFTCEKGTLHLNEDVLHFEKEYLDRKRGRFIPILTDLYRSTQPIIRYRLDDILIEGTCTCGLAFQAIEGVEGRLKDLIQLQDKKGQPLHLFARDFGALFSEDYLVEQTDTNTLVLYGGCPHKLRNFLETVGAVETSVIHQKDLPKRKDHEKLRRVMRSF